MGWADHAVADAGLPPVVEAAEVGDQVRARREGGKKGRNLVEVRGEVLVWVDNAVADAGVPSAVEATGVGD